MRTFSLITSATVLLCASAATENLRGTERSLYVATYGGNAFMGNYPIDACFHFERYPEAKFWDCDGKAAADFFCHKEGYARSVGFDLTDFRGLKLASSLVVGSDKVVEAALHEPEQKVITNVQCAQE
ncbi:hypothetical protein NSK_001322 [Nannochloropsis salina CCMP1776]|uniref:Uncharacterized protein n=1 Tax=Nannochloropsis salina CCMP1776 TaxID=1027361 RepID=A0A4D9DE63_9STRA|nr:hypothetical protein NSK_001322 [Nannochloropsis salina CCMP1776]|eukprot:TFJ86988.1 hypothetical protein NSK_001322 [Nannochloropsis salina CCMP1776]